MQLASFLLVVALSIGTVSPLFFDSFKWPPWESPIFMDPMRVITNEMCSYFAKYPERADKTLNTISQTLMKKNMTTMAFSQTLAYINTPGNRAKLSGGTSSCPTFFNEVKEKLAADCKSQNFNAQDAQKKAMDTLKEWQGMFKDAMP